MYMEETEERLCFIKLVSGEELISMMSSIEDNELKLIILNHPLKISIIEKSEDIPSSGLKLDHWLKFSDDYVFTLNFDKVMTMTRVKNPNLKYMYKKFVTKYGDTSILSSNNDCEIKMNKSLGMIGSVEETRDKLESLFNSKSVSSI